MQMESHWEIMLEENRELLDYMLSGSGALTFSVDFFSKQKQQKSRVQARARPATLSAFPNLMGGHYHHGFGMPLWPAGKRTALSIDFLSSHRPL